MSVKKPLISVKNLHAFRGKNLVLKDLTFDIFEGDYIGIVGPNGGGKTTLIKILLGLLPKYSGTIEVHENKIGYVPQQAGESSFLFPMTVEEVVKTGMKNRTEKGLKEALQKVNLLHLRHRSFQELSGGERQRVVISRALASSPRLLFLDEPLSAVDHTSQKAFFELLADLHQKEKITLLMVTHDVHSITSEANRILCLNQILYDECKTIEGNHHVILHSPHSPHAQSL